MTRGGIAITLFFIALLINACGEPLTPIKLIVPSTYDIKQYESANSQLGGKLYDQWFQGNTPTELHPIWEDGDTDGVQTNNGIDWQCVTCHGWNYNGQYNFPGLRRATRTRVSPQETFDFIKDGITENGKSHNFSTSKMLDAQIYQLTKFIVEEDLNIDFPLAGNNIKQGESIYKNNPATTNRRSCNASSCHGNNIIINEIKLKTIANTNPMKFIHKVRFGQPGKSMPGGLDITEAKNLVAYVQKLDLNNPKPNNPGENPTSFNQTLFTTSDEIRGGKLYDKWWTVKNTSPPTSPKDHLLWASRAKDNQGQYLNPRSDSDSWLCTECHGWDYKGKAGIYAQDNNHYTGFVGILQSAKQRVLAEQIFNFLKTDTSHSYGSHLNEKDLYDLTRFIINRRTEISLPNPIDNKGQAKIQTADNLSKGQTLFKAEKLGCGQASCHGNDGTMIDFQKDTPDKIQEFIDTLAKTDPWQFIHKTRFGQPGITAMPAMADTTFFTYQLSDASDLLAYAQTWLNPDTQRGGRLFDKWYAERKVEDPDFAEPSIDQPKWASRETDPMTGNKNAATGADTWRCKECHGWDYQGIEGAYRSGNAHYTGFKNILPTATSWANTNELQNAFLKINGNGNNNHSFGNTITTTQGTVTGLTIRDLADLSSFIINEIGAPKDENGDETLNDVSYFISGVLTGDSEKGLALYHNPPGNCVACHGTTGTSTPNVDIGDLANNKPERFMHKVRVGSPNSTMTPGQSGFEELTITQAANLLAYASELQEAPSQSSYTTADVIRGGRLFDTWWLEKTITEPDTQPPNSTNPHWKNRRQSGPDINERTGDDTWRCKECHGWDYDGANGAYGTGDHYTGFNGIAQILDAEGSPAERSPQALFDYLKTGRPIANEIVHDFGQFLNNRDLWDLVRFIKEGQIDTYSYLFKDFHPITGEPIYSPRGNASNGKTLYESPIDADPTGGNCFACHGIKGDTINFGQTNGPAVYLGDLARENIWKFIHKARFGQPGTNMPGTINTSLNTLQLMDIIAHAITLNQ